MKKIQTILFVLGFMVSMNAFADLTLKNLTGIMHSLKPHQMICFSEKQSDPNNLVPWGTGHIYWWIGKQNIPYNFTRTMIRDGQMTAQDQFSGIYGGQEMKSLGFPQEGGGNTQYKKSITTCFYNNSLISTIQIEGILDK